MGSKLNGRARNSSIILSMLGIVASVAGLLWLFVRPIADRSEALELLVQEHYVAQEAHGISGLAKRQDDIMRGQEQIRRRQEEILDAILELSRSRGDR